MSSFEKELYNCKAVGAAGKYDLIKLSCMAVRG